ncbi:MAG: GAK system ATP-grasp enzyme [Limnobacter sp.]|nr:GAK system ATP-grasp enzyme [Limnobacter sp.]
MYPFKVGVVGIPEKWSTEALADELEKRTGFRQVFSLSEVSVYSDGTCLLNGQDLSTFDALVVKKITQEYSSHTLDSVEILKAIERAGVRLFSPAGEIARLVNRASCTQALLQAGVPMPPSLLTGNVQDAVNAVVQWGGAVFKPLYSTKGRGMILLDPSESENRLRQQVHEFQQSNPLLYVQKKIDLSGQDLGLVFLAGQYQGAYARVAPDGHWQTTLQAGGHYAPFRPTQAVIDLAKKAQDVFNLDFTTVDVALTPGGAVVFEVSAFGGFKGAKEGAGLDAPALYAQSVCDKLSVSETGQTHA